MGGGGGLALVFRTRYMGSGSGKAPQLDVKVGLGLLLGTQFLRLSSMSQQLPLHGPQERLCTVLTHMHTHRSQDLALDTPSSSVT